MSTNVLKDKLLSLGNIVAFQIPDDSTVYYMRRMTCGEREVYVEEQGKKTVWHNQRMLLALTLCDQFGTRLFDAPDELKPMDMGLIDALSKQAVAVNGFTQTAEDEIEKKLKAQRDTSGISSPSDSIAPSQS